jgi:hypothetical protein
MMMVVKVSVNPREGRGEERSNLVAGRVARKVVPEAILLQICYKTPGNTGKSRANQGKWAKSIQ